MTTEKQARRNFLQLAAAGSAASLAGAVGASAMYRATDASTAYRGGGLYRMSKRRFQLGLASYSLRKLNLDQTLAMTKRVGLNFICFKSFHLPLGSTPQQIADVVKKVKDAGLILYGGGVISMKTESDIDRAFEYAKAAGMTVIVAGNLPYDLLGHVDKKVKQYDMKVAIHNHGPGDKLYPTPDRAYDRIKPYDKRIGFCHDIGHTQRLGVDPAVSTEKTADRLHDVHPQDPVKDQLCGNRLLRIRKRRR